MPRLRKIRLVVTAGLGLLVFQLSLAGSLHSKELPKIESNTVVDGKGIPNGRSDSIAPFMSEAMQQSTDPSYGYTPSNPIRVGPRTSAKSHILFLNALRGAQGEPMSYERKGSCCAFETPHSPLGGGMLDIYTIKVQGSDQEIHLFVNMYDPGPAEIPVGFSQRH
jgi:hypothetical protein